MVEKRGQQCHGAKNLAEGRNHYSSGLIILHGYATPGVLNDATSTLLKTVLPKDVRMVCPTPPKRSDTGSPLPVNAWKGNNWFNMITNNGLPEAMGLIDEYLEDMKRHGIPSNKVVLMGLSQGGAVTLYYALNTRYSAACVYVPRTIVLPA